MLFKQFCCSKGVVILSTHLTYKEIGTNVLRTMAYEKNTNVPIVIDPASLSDGTNESQGRYIWKYQPVLNSQMADPIMQDKHSKKRHSTICKMKTNVSLFILNETFSYIMLITPMMR